MSDSIVYTNPVLVSDVSVDSHIRRNPYASGYGAKIPTAYRVRYDSRWYRVYVMCWSNSGTAYITSRGQRLVIDTDTEYRLRDVARITSSVLS